MPHKMPPPLPRPEKPLPLPSPPQPNHPHPLLRLKIQDLSNAHARTFLSVVNAADILDDAVHTVLDLLYPGSKYGEVWPGTRSVTLILSAFAGVAYTRGRDLDHDHKEIHLSTRYIGSVKPELLKREITGVIVHEMVHCWQWNGCDAAPGGLIEGIADWVRLRADLSPPHWKRTSGDRWDAGYQITAWFLDWLEDEHGPGLVPRLNHMLKDVEYDEKEYWFDRCGMHKSVQQLWKEYKRWLADRDDAMKVRNDDECREEAEKVQSVIATGEKSSIVGDEKADSGKNEDRNGGSGEDGSNDHNENVNVDSEIDGGWTDLSSSGLELKRRESELNLSGIDINEKENAT